MGGGCPSDENQGTAGLEGSRPGYVRYVVYFADEPADLTAYRKARAAGEDVGDIVALLQDEARKRRLDFAKRIAELGGVVVDYWPLTNAVTVEIPDGSVATLGAFEGLARVVPDKAYAPPGAAGVPPS